VTSQAFAEQVGAPLMAQPLPSCDGAIRLGAFALRPPPSPYTSQPCAHPSHGAGSWWVVWRQACWCWFAVPAMWPPLACRPSLPCSIPPHAATPCSWAPRLCGLPHLGASHGAPFPLRRAPGGSFEVWPWYWLWLRVLGFIPASFCWCEPLSLCLACVPLRSSLAGLPFMGLCSTRLGHPLAYASSQWHPAGGAVHVARRGRTQ
jgi:hypothetical protein